MAFTIPIVPTIISKNRTLSQVTVGWQPMVPDNVLEFADTLSSPRGFPYAGVVTNQVTLKNRSRRLLVRLRKSDTFQTGRAEVVVAGFAGPLLVFPDPIALTNFGTPFLIGWHNSLGSTKRRTRLAGFPQTRRPKS